MRIVDLHCYPGTAEWIRCQGPYVEALAKYWKRETVRLKRLLRLASRIVSSALERKRDGFQVTIADRAPNIKRLVQVSECLLWLVKKVINQAHVGERHGFTAPVGRFTHQAQRFAELLDRLAPRLRCPFIFQLCTGKVRTLRGNACSVCAGRGSQILDPHFVSSSRCSFLQRAYFELVDTIDFRHQRNYFHASCAAQVVIDFEQWFSIRS